MNRDKKYTWSLYADLDIWTEGLFNTPDACVKDYLSGCIDKQPTDSLFIGEVVPYRIEVDGNLVIDILEEQAVDECGEVAEYWTPSEIKGVDKWNELEEQLTEVVNQWLEKYNELPDFCSIVNIVSVPTAVESLYDEGKYEVKWIRKVQD